MTAQLKEMNSEIVKAKMETQQVGAIKEEIETVQQEIQRGRSAIEYEKKTRAFNLEQEKVLEKNRILLVREIMKLRAELANAEKRARAAAAAGNPSPGYGRIYGRAEVGYGGSSYPDPNDPQQYFQYHFMDDIEVPRFFICPIYLQIMKDPVTTITGITYDRESIERWLFTGGNTTCPVTKQPLPKDSDLTPNHTVRRLIQAWCTENASHGVDRIPTPKPCLDKAYVLKLIKNLSHHKLQIKTLTQMELLAAESERNKKCMVQAGLPKAMLVFIVSCFENGQVSGIEEALSILCLIKIPGGESREFLCENDKIIESLTWVLGCKMENSATVKSHAVSVLRILLEDASSGVLERLKPEFFERIVGVLREKITQQGIKSALEVLLYACPLGRNRKMMVQSGAVFELIELELGSPERRTTELNLGVLSHLCCCAEGRAQFLSHGGGIAVVAMRILRVSPAVDDPAILILSSICKFSGTSMVIKEMVDVKAVSKLCVLLQADCAPYLKDKAKEILRSHFDEWKNFPCNFSSLSCLLEYKVSS